MSMDAYRRPKPAVRGIRTALAGFALLACWIARPGRAATPVANSADVLDALRKLTYFEYARTPRSDAAEEGRLKDKLRDATGGAVGRADIDAMFDAADEKAFAVAWDRFRAVLPDRDRWYVAAAVNPLSPAERSKPVTVAAGIVDDRATRTVTIDGRPTEVNVITLAAGCVRARHTYKTRSNLSDALPPTEIVIYREACDEDVAGWSAARAGFSNEIWEAQRVALCRAEVAGVDPPWETIAGAIAARTVFATSADDWVRLITSNSIALNAGRLSALKDADLLFAVNRARLGDDERAGELLLRGALNLACDGDYPEMGFAALAFVAASDSQPVDVRLGSRLILYRLGDALAGVEPHGLTRRQYRLADTFLSRTLDREKIRFASRRVRGAICAEMNLSLLPTWPSDRNSKVAEVDRPAVARVADHAIATCPGDDVVRVTAATAMVQAGLDDKAEPILRDLSDHCPENALAGDANESLARIELHRRHFKEALALLDQADRQVPGNSKALYWRLYALLGDGQYAAAEVVRKQFLKTDFDRTMADEVRAIVIPDGRPATESADRSGKGDVPDQRP